MVTRCSHKHSPLWAITVCKSEGLTSEKAAINLREVDFTPGPFFVEILWVEQLLVLLLLFNTLFSISCLLKPHGSSGDLDTDVECCRHLPLGYY